LGKVMVAAVAEVNWSVAVPMVAYCEVEPDEPVKVGP